MSEIKYTDVQIDNRCFVIFCEDIPDKEFIKIRRLIAAAPEMYELMKIWVQVQAQPTLRNAQDKARELLARIDSNSLKGGEA